MPASNCRSDKLFLMGKTEKLRVLNHVRTVASVAIEVDSNANVVEQCRSFQKFAVAFA